MPQALARIPKTDTRSAGDALPALYRPDPKTERRVLEFFTANIRNKNTRAAYGRAVSDFAAWCDPHGIKSLDLIEPVHVAAYVEDLQGRTSSSVRPVGSVSV